MEQGVREAVAVKDLAAAARHQGTWFLRRHPVAGLPHRIFPIGPVPFVAPSLKIRLGPVRQEHLPRRFEVGAGLVEGGCSAVRTFPRVAARIKTAIPAPGIFARWHAGSDRDRADAHVTVIDVPAFVGSIERAAAGELGHALSKRYPSG